MSLALGAALSLVAVPALASSSSTTLSNGALLTVELTTPASDATYLVPSGATDVDVPLAGSASIGVGDPNVHWTYVIDVSSSTGSGCDTTGGTVLDCEKEAVTNLNNIVDADGSGLDVGLAVFSENGASADMSPAPDEQLLASPDNPDVDTVIGSVDTGQVNQYTAHNVGSGATNFAAGLQSSLASVTASSAAAKNVVFLSDGKSNWGTGFGDYVNALSAEGATVYSFAVGSGSSCTAGTNGTLQQMADSTGGTCTPVPDPADLPQIVTNVTATQLTSLSVSVDGTATSLTSLSPPLPLSGPATTEFTATAAHQTPGEHEACATADGTATNDGTPGSATTCTPYDVYGFGLTPVTVTNELGNDHTHTVTATVSGPAGKLAGWPVSFTVAGTNAGVTGDCSTDGCITDSDGHVTFTYSVPVTSASLGTDSISATVSVNSDTATLTATKTWVDTTPPTSACVPGPNPDGVIPEAPGNGGQGQNQDGFYTVSGTDDVWANADVKVYVQDDGSGHVFGPYSDPTNIKYIQANGVTPSEMTGDGAVDVFLKGQGDPLVYAVDGSDNYSTAISCLVPAPPQ